MRTLFTIAGAVIIFDALIAVFRSNIHLGVVLTFVLGMVLLFVGIFYEHAVKYISRALRYVFVSCFIFGMVFLIALFGYGKKSNVNYNEDAVIVLGAGIQGEEVSESLRNRLDVVMRYYQKNSKVIIIVSGGQGPQEIITEALAMERYLLEQGVPAEQIIKEQMATSTWENFLYSKEILDRQFSGAYKVAFISSDYHIYRAKLIAKSIGFAEITYLGSDTPWYQILPSGIRECLAVMKQWVLPQK